MPAYQTPDVYIEELATLPPSVTEVSTAIPAFLGYTASNEYKNTPKRITSFLDFTSLFGGPAPISFTVDMNKIPAAAISEKDTNQAHTLYYLLELYFKNGGGDCYIVSLGGYAAKNKNDFSAGLDALKREDEPTLIVLSEAATLTKDYYEICKQALQQCADLQDRFCIFDVLPPPASEAANKDTTVGIDGFRNAIGTQNLNYGAAYYPYLNTTLNYRYKEDNVTVADAELAEPNESTVNNEPVKDKTASSAAATGTSKAVTLSSLKTTNPLLYNAAKQEMNKLRLVLPPAAAIAGVYAATDRTRGVWKAPANVSLNAVVGPTIKITSSQQESLNISTTGLSINAIRSFTGKGTLVWGARTLDGSSNQWRYIPVRRLFIFIEESAKKASAFAVFEPNTAVTWLKVKGMIESFLYGLWQQGALAGSTAEAAYYVNLGLKSTMREEDIQAGRMIVEIGIAAVRPAEFIVLRFSHKLQEI